MPIYIVAYDIGKTTDREKLELEINNSMIVLRSINLLAPGNGTRFAQNKGATVTIYGQWGLLNYFTSRGPGCGTGVSRRWLNVVGSERYPSSLIY